MIISFFVGGHLVVVHGGLISVHFEKQVHKDVHQVEQLYCGEQLL